MIKQPARVTFCWVTLAGIGFNGEISLPWDDFSARMKEYGLLYLTMQYTQPKIYYLNMEESLTAEE